MVQQDLDMKNNNDKLINLINSQYNRYFIYLNENHGYYIEVKRQYSILLLLEYLSDFLGFTCIYPKFLNNRYYKNYSTALENVRKHITLII